MGTRWRGLLAPLGVSTGDGRRVAPDGVTNRPLPLPLKWQRTDEAGHDASVIVGSLETINKGTVGEAVDQGWITRDVVASLGMDDAILGAWGDGELFDDADPADLPRLAEDVREAMLLTSKGVIGPSVDAGAAAAVLVEAGSDNPLTGDDFERLYWAAEDTGEEPEIELLFTEYEIAAATLVSIPAFAQCRPFELVADQEPALTAAVRDNGWNTMPIADRDVAWDGGAAAGRLAEHCGCDGDSPDWSCYASGFLFVDDEADPQTRGAYGFGIADLVDDEPMIIPRAVSAVAAVLDGGRGGTNLSEADQDAMRGVLSAVYKRMAKQFDDPEIVAPWDAATTADRYAALTAGTPTYPAEWFADPYLPTLTPITVTEDGRVFGHVATHDVCHVGIRDACQTAPVDDHGYPHFNRYPFEAAPGVMVSVGRLTVGHGRHANTCGHPMCRGNDDHACNTMTAVAAMAHHDKMATVAWVVAGEDTTHNAIWIAGVVDPRATVDDLAVMQRRKVSGDWREINGELSLVEVLVLSREKPGFPLPRVRLDHGAVSALTAASPVIPTADNTAGVDPLDPDVIAAKIADRLGPIIHGSLTYVRPRTGFRFTAPGPGIIVFDGAELRFYQTSGAPVDTKTGTWTKIEWDDLTTDATTTFTNEPGRFTDDWAAQAAALLGEVNAAVAGPILRDLDQLTGKETI